MFVNPFLPVPGGSPLQPRPPMVPPSSPVVQPQQSIYGNYTPFQPIDTGAYNAMTQQMINEARRRALYGGMGQAGMALLSSIGSPATGLGGAFGAMNQSMSAFNPAAIQAQRQESLADLQQKNAYTDYLRTQSERLRQDPLVDVDQGDLASIESRKMALDTIGRLHEQGLINDTQASGMAAMAGEPAQLRQLWKDILPGIFGSQLDRFKYDFHSSRVHDIVSGETYQIPKNYADAWSQGLDIALKEGQLAGDIETQTIDPGRKGRLTESANLWAGISSGGGVTPGVAPSPGGAPGAGGFPGGASGRPASGGVPGQRGGPAAPSGAPSPSSSGHRLFHSDQEPPDMILREAEKLAVGKPTTSLPSGSPFDEDDVSAVVGAALDHGISLRDQRDLIEDNPDFSSLDTEDINELMRVAAHRIKIAKTTGERTSAYQGLETPRDKPEDVVGPSEPEAEPEAESAPSSDAAASTRRGPWGGFADMFGDAFGRGPWGGFADMFGDAFDAFGRVPEALGRARDEWVGTVSSAGDAWMDAISSARGEALETTYGKEDFRVPQDFPSADWQYQGNFDVPPDNPIFPLRQKAIAALSQLDLGTRNALMSRIDAPSEYASDLAMMEYYENLIRSAEIVSMFGMGSPSNSPF